MNERVIDLQNIKGISGLVSNSIGLFGFEMKAGTLLVNNNMRSYARCSKLTKNRTVVSINNKIIGTPFIENIPVTRAIGIALGEYIYETCLHPVFYGLQRDKLPFKVIEPDLFATYYSYLFYNFLTIGRGIESLPQHKALVDFVRGVNKYKESKAMGNTKSKNSEDGVFLYINTARAKELQDTLANSPNFTKEEKAILKDYILLLGRTKYTKPSQSPEGVRLMTYIHKKAGVGAYGKETNPQNPFIALKNLTNPL